MYQHTRLTSNRLGFFQKFKNFDYILLFCILLLGFISLATMYSTDGGEVLFHTKSHFIKLVVFITMMLVISFINIKYWFAIGYLSYITVIALLIGTYLFGITSSGSQRWINLYFINLQPSELMKIFIILCLAKYFHRMKLENVNSTVAAVAGIKLFGILDQYPPIVRPLARTRQRALQAGPPSRQPGCGATAKREHGSQYCIVSNTGTPALFQLS